MSSAIYFLYTSTVDHRHLHSFPTRRSSDLGREAAGSRRRSAPRGHRPGRGPPGGRGCAPPPCASWGAPSVAAPPGRSEEHTSELQSRGHLVCRLLLEKKKQNVNIIVQCYKK